VISEKDPLIDKIYGQRLHDHVSAYHNPNIEGISRVEGSMDRQGEVPSGNNHEPEMKKIKLM